jgi:hypothetical protein
MTISIFCRLLGSQPCLTDPIAEETVGMSSPVVEQQYSKPAVEPRYSKRKRTQVIYNEFEEDEFLLDEEVEEYEPKAKVCC